ncbi:MAG: hypothetical protein ACD_23C00844G0002 [uncultured bacterium]|nr:MAG: hypothetical protein ACD_23C00844G0002 [uncultured bacterium]
MHCRLFMAHQHMLNGVLLVQRVVDVQNCAAWVAPDVLNVFGLQRLDEDFRTHEVLRAGGGGVALGGSGCRCEFSLCDFHDQPL